MKNLKTLFAAATAILAVGILSSIPARADFNGGGPVMMNGKCWFPSSPNDHGYWAECPRQMYHHRRMLHEEKK